MEIMRRAAIYADQDPQVAGALLGAVLARAKAVSADPQAAALAWFDAGYLVESYRQLDLAYRFGMRAPSGRAPLLPPEAHGLDGYVLVQKALVLAPTGRQEIEFAASLMSDDADAAAHRARAAAGVAAGSSLQQNLALFAAE
jgi:hypothetical protein